MFLSGPLLVGFDGSRSGYEALALTADLAGALDRRIEVLSVLTYAPPSATIGEYDAMLHRDEKRLATEARAALEGAEVETWMVPSNSPARELHDFAVAHDAAALVLGSTHRRPLGRVYPGAMVDRLLAASPCPIAVAPAGHSRRTEAYEEIAVAFDGSPEARAALRAACLLGERDHARIKLIGVANPHDTNMAAAAAGPWAGLAATEEATERECSRLQGTIEDATAALDLKSIGEVVVDFDPAGAILRAAAGSDLIVSGSRGYGPLGRVLLGSVSHGLLREASCPVIVTPRLPTGDPDPHVPAFAAETAEGHWHPVSVEDVEPPAPRTS